MFKFNKSLVPALPHPAPLGAAQNLPCYPARRRHLGCSARAWQVLLGQSTEQLHVLHSCLTHSHIFSCGKSPEELPSLNSMNCFCAVVSRAW